MELSSDFDPADQVSQLLRAIRIRSAVYLPFAAGCALGFGVEADGSLAFRIVTAGRCWLEVDARE